MDNAIFDIEFEFDGIQYRGRVQSSSEFDGKGTPVSFDVVLDDMAYGTFSFKDCRWTVNEHRPAPLVKLIGKQIEKHYQL